MHPWDERRASKRGVAVHMVRVREATTAMRLLKHVATDEGCTLITDIDLTGIPSTSVISTQWTQYAVAFVPGRLVILLAQHTIHLAIQTAFRSSCLL